MRPAKNQLKAQGVRTRKSWSEHIMSSIRDMLGFLLDIYGRGRGTGIARE